MEILGQGDSAAVFLTPGANEGVKVLDIGCVGRLSLHCHGDTFDVDAADIPKEDEPHTAVSEALRSQACLAKTVINEHWVEFIHQLQGPRFRTCTSLPPPMGKGMRFFGGTSSYSVGVLWDRRKLDLSEAYIWPSGYFAKSDHNIDANGRLMNGREAALVTLEAIMDSNLRKSYRHHLTNEEVCEEVLPYNEVLTFVHGVQGIVGIFARSDEISHLLWSMGIRSLLQRTLPAVGELPLFVHHPVDGMRPVSRAAQASVVRTFLQALHPHVGGNNSSFGLPCLPINTSSIELTVLEQIRLHGAYGLTQDALSASLQSIQLRETEEDTTATDTIIPAQKRRGTLEMCPDSARQILAFGLQEAVTYENPASASSLIRMVAPLLFSASSVTNSALSLSTRASITSSKNALACSTRTQSEFCDFLHQLCSGTFTRGVMVAIGSLIALEDFSTGAMLPRIAKACHQLEAWLAQSGSFFYRVGSWAELVRHQGPGRDSGMTAFMTKHAVENRQQFHDELIELERYEEAHDVLHGMQHLGKLISHLHHPCLRLEILQTILGLDARFDLGAVSEVANMALGIISDMPGHTLRPGDAEVLPENRAAKSHQQLAACALHMQGLSHPEVDGAFDAEVLLKAVM